MTSLNTANNANAKSRRREVLKALTGILAGMFVAVTSLTIVGTALPTLIRDLHGSQSAYTWVITGSMLAGTISTIIAGKLSDQFHKKPLLMWGFGLFALGALLSGFAWNTTVLILFRAVQGVGLGFQIALSGAVIASIIPPRERGKYNGYLGAVIAVATVSGPLFGGVIVDVLGWRWCFWVAVPFTLVAMWIVHRRLVVPPAPKRTPKIDYGGSLLITVGVTLLMLWMTESSKTVNLRDWKYWALPVASILILAFFAWWETRAAEPIIPFSVLNTRITWLAILSSIMLGVSQSTVGVFLGQYFQLGRGYTPTVAGLGLLPISLGSMVASTAAGLLVSSRGRWKPAVVSGMLMLVVGNGLMSVIDHTTPYWYVTVAMVLLGFGQGTAMQNLVLAVQNTVAYKDIGASTAAVTFARTMGGALGLQLLGALFNANLTRHVRAGAHQLISRGVDAGELHKLSHVGDLSLMTGNGPVAAMLTTSYANAMAIVFIASAVLTGIGFVASLFMTSTTLRDSVDIED